MQCGQRCARIGIDIAQWGQGLSVGAAGTACSCLRRRLIACDQNEHRPRDNDEADDVIDERAVIDSHGACVPRLLERRVRPRCIRSCPQYHEQVREVDVSEQEPDRRHDDVIDERLHDRAERSADDDADSHVHDAALDGELAEFLEHSHHSTPPFRIARVERPSVSIWSNVQCDGSLSGRQRRKPVAWRKRPSLKWS